MRIDKDSKLLNFYIPLFLLFVGFFWKIFYIEHRDICLDEPFTIFNAQKSIGEIIKLSTSNEPTPSLFMILIHFWIKLFGIGSFSVRFLPLVFNAFTVLFIYFAGKRFFSFWAGLVASGLFLFSTLHFFHGLNTRTYSLVSLETAASLYFFLRYAENLKDRKALAGLIISNLLLVYSHYFGWFVILSQVISSFFYTRNLKMFFRFMIPPFATVFGFIPMIPIMIKQFITKSDHGTWLNSPKPLDYLNQLYRFLNYKEVFWMIVVVIGVGIIFTLIMVFRKQWKGFNISVLVLLLWWIIPYSIMFFASSKLPMFNNNYNLFNSIGLYLFIGAVINFLFQKNKYFEPAIGLAVLIFMCVYMRILPNDFAYREVSKSVDFVKSAKNENSIVILYPFWSDLQFTYYYNREIFTDHQNFYELMKKNDLFNVWGLPHTKQIIEANPNKRVIYIQDGSMKDQKSSIFRFLDSAYVKRDSVYFPQTIQVCVYDLKLE
jgi:uncharacterized membrane protein